MRSPKKLQSRKSDQMMHVKSNSIWAREYYLPFKIFPSRLFVSLLRPCFLILQEVLDTTLFPLIPIKLSWIGKVVFPLGELLWFFGMSILFPENTPEPLFWLLYLCYGSNTRAGFARASQLTEVGGMAYKCIHRRQKDTRQKIMSTFRPSRTWKSARIESNWPSQPVWKAGSVVHHCQRRRDRDEPFSVLDRTIGNPDLMGCVFHDRKSALPPKV